MQFHEFGDNGNPKLLVMHGMLCDWRKFREIFMPLERDYRVIYPAMNGCYDGAPDFRIFDGYGHGQKMIRDTDDYLREIRKTL